MERFPCGGKKVLVVDVWAHNQEAELDLIRSLLPEFPILAVISSPGVAAPSAAGADNPDSCYDRTRHKVDSLRFVQLALGLANDKAQLASRRIWRFNFGDFQADDLRLFACLGVDFPARRADPHRFGELLTYSMAVLNPAVTWIISDGADQVAYLAKCLRGGLLLPPTRLGFLRICRAFFPTLYDIMVLPLPMSDAPAPNESFKRQPPAVWESCSAGSDSDPLVAAYASFVSCLTLMQDPAFAKLIKSYNGFVSRLGDGDTRTIGYHDLPWRIKEVRLGGPCCPEDPLHLSV